MDIESIPISIHTAVHKFTNIRSKKAKLQIELNEIGTQLTNISFEK